MHFSIRFWSLALALLLVAGAARAQSAWPGVPSQTMLGDDQALATHFFPSKPASVAVDGWFLQTVIPGAGAPEYQNAIVSSNSVFTNRAAVDVFGNDEVWGVSPYDVGNDFWYGALDWTACREGTIVLRWKPAGVDCSASPASCPFTFNHIGGEACYAAMRERWSSFVYATTTSAGQGIDDKVMAYYSRRGQLPIRWQLVLRGPSTKPAAEDPDALLYRVYQYKSGLAWPHVSCVVETATNPETLLPSFQQCSGN